MSDDFAHLRIAREGAIAFVTIDNPPINLLTQALFAEIGALFAQIKADDSLSVIVFKSANPDFFLAHYDVQALIAAADAPPEKVSRGIARFQAFCSDIQKLDKVTIAQIAGRVGGGGAELVSNFDMRFGVRGAAILNQMEVPLGILPGGTGTQMLPRLVGRARAMEIVLGADDIDADTAEKWGFFNRIYDADEIEGAVRRLAERIAAFPAAAVRAAKLAVDSAAKPNGQGYDDERNLFVALSTSAAAKAQMEKFMARGGQTAEIERRIGAASFDLCAE